MEEHRGKNTGATGNGYKAVIALPDDWTREFAGPTPEQLKAEGWKTTPEVARMLNCHRTTAGEKLRTAEVEGRVESVTVNVAGHYTRYWRLKNVD